MQIVDYCLVMGDLPLPPPTGTPDISIAHPPREASPASDSRITSAQSQSAGSSAETVSASTISEPLSAPVWEFEPRNSRDFYLACRPDAFTEAELDTLAQSASVIAGLEAAREALIAKRAALPSLGSEPANSLPRPRAAYRPLTTNEALAVGIASVVVSGGLAVRDGWEARALFGEQADGPFAEWAKAAAWKATVDGFFTYAVVVGGVAGAALAGRRWVLRKRDAEYDAQQVEFSARQQEPLDLDTKIWTATNELGRVRSVDDAKRASVIDAAEKRLDEHVWQQRSIDAGYQLPRSYASTSGLVYTAARGFQKSDLQNLESVDRRRCGLLIGSGYLNQELTESEYQLVLAGLEINDPRSASGTTRRGRRFEELTRGLSQQQIDELLIARARDRHGFIGYSQERKEFVRIFDAGFRHMKIVTTGDPRPVEYRGAFGRFLTKSVGFTRQEIAQLEAEEPAW